MPTQRDAFGRFLADHLDGRALAASLVERSDGFIDADHGAELYFAPFSKWPPAERQAMRNVRGRVLDVGAGAGRVALHLQDRGHDVVAIDNSPLAIDVCRRRGVRDARVLPFTRLAPQHGPFDTIVMFGQNFGLFGSLGRARWMLRRLRSITSPDARIVGATLDPYDTDDSDHHRYHRENRRRGRMAGQIRLRVRYRRLVTPWFDYLFVSPDEMRALVEGTGWTIERLIEPEGSPSYVAVLKRTDDVSSLVRRR